MAWAVATAPGSSQGPEEAIDVLFLGNSYIYFNNLPQLVEGIASELDGPKIRTGIHTHGGFSLGRHLEDGHVPDVLEPNGSGEPWDRVVLQEQSQLGTPLADPEIGKLGDPEGFRTATRRLVELIRARDAETLMYMTWAKERFPEQISDLSGAYDGIAAELGVDVAPVGLAWARVRHERPDIALFIEDGSHPNPAGSYFAACVFYAELTGLSPEGAPREIAGLPWNYAEVMSSELPTVLVSLTPDVAGYLQRVAWETVRDREVTGSP